VLTKWRELVLMLVLVLVLVLVQRCEMQVAVRSAVAAWPVAIVSMVWHACEWHWQAWSSRQRQWLQLLQQLQLQWWLCDHD